MKLNNKGKVYPSPSSSSDTKSKVLSVLNLLPPNILPLTSDLPLDDCQVLAYMIRRSLYTPTTNPKNPSSSKKLPPSVTSAKKKGKHQVRPEFECECFDCYTRYWSKWDSSPNRERIDQVMEAFEDDLDKAESFKKNPRKKHRGRADGRRVEPAGLGILLDPPPDRDVEEEKEQERPVVLHSPEEVLVEEDKEQEERPVVEDGEEVLIGKVDIGEEEEEVVAAVNAGGAVGGSHHKCLARKVWAEVLALLNSRLWRLPNPNMA